MSTATRPAPHWRVRSTRTPGQHPWLARRKAILGQPWYVLSPFGFYSGSFPTWAEAWDYALAWAGDPEAELRTEVGT